MSNASNFYIVNEDCNYIKITSDNRYVIVEDREEAKLFNSSNSVAQVLKCIPKTVRDGHTWKAETEDTGATINNEYIKVDRADVLEAVEKLSSLIQTLEGNKSHLHRMLTNTNQERQDVLHFLENYTFSASEGYMRAKQIKEISNRRREIKNELRMIDNLSRITSSSLADGKITHLIRSIDEQSYTPRVLVDIFEEREPRD